MKYVESNVLALILNSPHRMGGSGDVIEVLRLLHDSIDLPRQLGESDE